MHGIMDEAWLAAANHAVDKYHEDPSRAWTAVDVVRPPPRAPGPPCDNHIATLRYVTLIYVSHFFVAYIYDSYLFSGTYHQL